MKIMDFRLPELGEGVYEAELVAWLVKPGDRIKRGQNLIEVLSAHMQPGRAPGAQSPPESPLDFGKPGARVKLAGVRRKIAEHMVLAKKTIPHYSYVDECEVTDLVRLREGVKESFAKQGV